MILALAAALVVIGAAAALGLHQLSTGRQLAATAAAAAPVVLDGTSVDLAEVIWSLRQVAQVPLLRALAQARVGSPQEILELVSSSVAALPAGQQAELVAARIRMQQVCDARETLGPTADLLASATGPTAADALAVAVCQAIATASDHDSNSQAAQFTRTGVPVVSVVMGIERAGRSGVAERQLIDGGERQGGAAGVGGSVADGLALGTAILPGVGSLVGALMGAAVGSGSAHLGKGRHLADARRRVTTSASHLSRALGADCLSQLSHESLRMLLIKTQHWQQLVVEAADASASSGWRQRTFRPTVGSRVVVAVVEHAGRDVARDQERHAALERAVTESAGSRNAAAYLWAAGRQLLADRGLVGPDTARLDAAAVVLAAEHRQQLSAVRPQAVRTD
jgi:hypothetical protein